jgi:uncharacterized membrane protein YkvA (DUF1232 family)
MSYNIDDENLSKAQEIIETGVDRAQEVLRNQSQVDDVLFQVADKLKEVPAAGPLLSDAPKMVSLVKAYLSKEYPEVSPKVVVSLIAAFIYLVKGIDLIPDFIPILGRVDDIAVIAAALKICEPELRAFEEWREKV